MSMNVDQTRPSLSGVPREELYERFHKLALFMVKKASWALKFGMDKDDLYQEAWVGVLYAWHHYDPVRDTKFTGYVSQCMDWSIKNAMRFWRFGPADFERWKRWREAGGQEPRIFSTICWRDETGRPFEDSIADERQFEVKRTEAKALLKRMCHPNATAKHKSMAIRYYILGSTLEEIARIYGISRERVRQLLQEVLPGVGAANVASIRASMRRGNDVALGREEERAVV